MDSPISSRMTKRDMRFILVNGRTPSSPSRCMRCSEPIGMGYLREIGTPRCYCDPACYAAYGKSAILTSAPAPEFAAHNG